jgi:type IV secretion system protein VirB5
MPEFIKPTPEEAYLQRHAALLVTNSRLRTLLALMGVFLCALTVGYVALAKNFASYKPMVIRINDVGHAEAITYSATEYKVQEAEIKYFLMDVIQKYYGRVRGAAKDDFARSLYFMAPKLADQRLAEEKETKALDNFILGVGDQVEVSITQISIEDLRQQPYRAVITYDKSFYSQLDHQLKGHAKFTAHVQFIVLDKVPHSLVPVNPLGLTITYLREDQAFGDDSKDSASRPAPQQRRSPLLPAEQ